MHKEGNETCLIYTIIYGCNQGLKFVLWIRALYFYSRVTKQHPVNKRFLNN